MNVLSLYKWLHTVLKLTSWSVRPQIFSIWPFTENICWSYIRQTIGLCQDPKSIHHKPGCISLAMAWDPNLFSTVTDRQGSRGTKKYTDIPGRYWGSVPDNRNKARRNLCAGGGSCLPCVKDTAPVELNNAVQEHKECLWPSDHLRKDEDRRLGPPLTLWFCHIVHSLSFSIHKVGMMVLTLMGLWGSP